MIDEEEKVSKLSTPTERFIRRRRDVRFRRTFRRRFRIEFDGEAVFDSETGADPTKLFTAVIYKFF